MDDSLLGMGCRYVRDISANGTVYLLKLLANKEEESSQNLHKWFAETKTIS